ncbi:MAG: ATP synthase F1 subunit delta [Bacteroidetes bacterium]|nr:ATP synthase F1 subunit delta [Bacteroidota bacterium]
MPSSKFAKRYARALIQIGNEKNNIKEFDKDLNIIFSAFEISKELRLIYANPIIARSKKLSILKSIFEGKVNEQILIYINGIIENKREAFIHEILKEYFLMRDEELGILKVDVNTSCEFTSSQKEKFKTQLENLTKKTINLKFKIDSTLKGGFVFRIGDTMYDSSIKRQLEILKNKFLQTELPVY